MTMSPSTLIALCLAGALTGCASTTDTTKIAAPAGEIPRMTLAAQGVQIHECRAAPGAAPTWVFVAPEADLFDADGRRIGHHGAGPTWQHEDGSGFVGTLRARMDAPRPGAIPWLLLSTKAQGPDGAFARVSSVQRVNTVGGQAPADGCGPATLGQRAHMAYRADYVLYMPRP